MSVGADAISVPAVPTLCSWPNILINEDDPEVPMLSCCEFATVMPAFPVINPEAVNATVLVSPELTVMPLCDVINPKTLRGLVVPDVPINMVCPVLTVMPALAFINPDVERVVKLVFAPVIVSPLLPVIKPNTLSGVVVPDVPIPTGCPLKKVVPVVLNLTYSVPAIVTPICPEPGL